MKRWWIIWPVLVVVAIVLFGIRPFLCMHRPLNGGKLIVEGWLPDQQLLFVQELFATGNYTGIITTGATRPCAYYLKQDERLLFTGINAARIDSMAIRCTGIPGISLLILADGDTIGHLVMQDGMVEHRSPVNRIAPDTLILVAHTPLNADPEVNIVFIQDLHLDGAMAHAVARSTIRKNALGAPSAGTTSYADHARARLIEIGLPASSIISVGGPLTSAGRTASGAEALGRYLSDRPMDSLEIVGSGLHARRSWHEFRKKVGGNVVLGSVNIGRTDKCCDPDRLLGGCWTQIWYEVTGLLNSQRSDM